MFITYIGNIYFRSPYHYTKTQESKGIRQYTIRSIYTKFKKKLPKDFSIVVLGAINLSSVDCLIVTGVFNEASSPSSVDFSGKYDRSLVVVCCSDRDLKG